MNPKPIHGFGPKAKDLIIVELREDEEEGEEFPIAVGQVVNTWCYTLLIKGQLVLLNIVKTAE